MIGGNARSELCYEATKSIEFVIADEQKELNTVGF